MRTLRFPSNFLLLTLPVHDQNRLPVPRRASARLLTSSRAAHAFRTMLERNRDNQVVTEFRTKMRVAEDLISKLAFSLKEIQGARRRKPKSEKAKPANLFHVGNDLRNVIRLHE